MDFELTKTQKEIQKAVREFAKGEFDKDLALELEQKHEFPRKIWEKAGEITSGSFSPTLGKAIAFARVPATIGDSCQVDVRGKHLNCTVVKPPFVRNGKACI